MKIFTLILITFCVSCNATQTNNNRDQNNFVLTNINIIDVANQLTIPSQTITVKDGIIDSITDALSPIPNPNFRVIDGNDGYVTPGLIDMHVHMYEKAAYILTLSHGVTHVRIMNGVPEQLIWRDNIASGLQVGSTSTVSSPIISGDKNALLHHAVETAEQAKSAVRDYQSKGYDLIKVYGNLNEVALTAMIEEGKNVGIPLAKHGPHASGNMAVSQLTGIQSFEHVEDIFQGPLNYQFAPEKLPEIISDLKATKVPVTPTLNIFYQLTKLSQDKEGYLATTSIDYTSDIIALEASTNQVKRWLEASDKMAAHNQRTLEFLLLITKRFHQSGIPLLVGSDSGVLLSPHGIATHTEMRLLEEAGLNSYDVLAAATINPAKALNLENQMGKVSLGFNADFIFSSNSPIENLSVLKEPEAVIKNGHWYAKEELTSMREQAIESRSFWQELSILFKAL